ncbi:MAG TPA: hypothetical protein VMR99_00970 [Candidatus Paceibacterota bacterium]|nr:hypothetical protein [Candidatus Paceibacterota bacterium]
MMCILAVCFSASAPGQQITSDTSSEVQAFQHAAWLSYDGKHDDTRTEFAKYKQSHPDDLLSTVRLSYDYLFDTRSKMSRAEYHDLLHKVNDAIALFELKKCAGTDLAGIAGNTLDCDYLGAALYSFRMALQMKNEKFYWGIMHLTALQADDDHFFLYARRSDNAGILQSRFLLGVHEYELSQSGIGSHTRDPHDRADALALIRASLLGTSPFADDQWFFVLDFENKNPNDVPACFKDYPRDAVIARLHSEYPDNGMTK